MFPYFQKALFQALNLTATEEGDESSTTTETIEPEQSVAVDTVELNTELPQPKTPTTVETSEGFTLISPDSNENSSDLIKMAEHKSNGTTENDTKNVLVADDVDSNEATDKFPAHLSKNNNATNGKAPSYIMELGEKRKRLR